MPFTYRISLSKEFIKANNFYISKWLISPGTWITAGTSIALVKIDDENYELLANGDGILSSCLLQELETAGISQEIAVIAADGEEIPYDRPTCILRKTKP